MKKFTEQEAAERAKNSRKAYANKESGKEVEKRARTKHRETRRQWLFDYKSKLSCVYCGIQNPLCMDLDHIDPSTKKGTPSTMVTNSTSWKAVMEEIEKCQPVCRNCHNIKSILEQGKLANQDVEKWVPQYLRHFISR